MSIVASPTLSSDVRHKATGLLRQMYGAYSEDKASSASASASASASKTKTNEKSPTSAQALQTNTNEKGKNNVESPLHVQSNEGQGQGEGEGMEELPTFTHLPPGPIDAATQAEARTLEHQLDEGQWEDRVEDTPISTDEVLRVHGIYMSQRRHFEVRVDKERKLILWDADEGKIWGT